MSEPEVIIVGSGIAGATLASLLAPSCRVLLLDRDVRGLPGSTGHAPGLVGKLAPPVPSAEGLTELARRSIAYYQTIPGGFDVVGGLEVTTDPDDMVKFEQRAKHATSQGIKARVVSSAEAQALAPELLGKIAGGIYFPDDGTANARILAEHGHDTAQAARAELRDADVLSIKPTDDGYTVSLDSGETLAAPHVVVCTGIWAGQLTPSLASTAVSATHPYAFSSPHPQRSSKSPWIRWPFNHVYARDHGDRDGLGTYAHDPVHVRPETYSTMRSSFSKWDDRFSKVVNDSLAFLHPKTAETFGGQGRTVCASGHGKDVDAARGAEMPYVYGGVFTVTPDGMPHFGKLETSGEGTLWAGVGAWVTQAGGAAQVLADMILDAMEKKEAPVEDKWLRTALDPRRFEGQDAVELEAAALASM